MVFETCGNNEKDYYFGGSLFVTDGLFCFTNAHGDVIALFDDDGTVTKRYEYDAFGVELNPDETDTNPYRYCAEYFDIESGTIYLRARYYNPAYGRFTQPDPHWNIGNRIYGDPDNTIADAELAVKVYLPDILAIRQSGNLYVYAINCPGMYIDPNGYSIGSFAEKVLNAIAVSIGIEGGVGYGVGVTAKIAGFDVGAEASHNTVVIGLSDGETYTASNVLFRINLGSTESAEITFTHLYEKGDKKYRDDHDTFTSAVGIITCENTTVSSKGFSGMSSIGNGNFEIGVGASLYLGVGANISLTFDVSKFWEAMNS